MFKNKYYNLDDIKKVFFFDEDEYFNGYKSKAEEYKNLYSNLKQGFREKQIICTDIIRKIKIDYKSLEKMYDKMFFGKYDC
jgi:hypothetical protein